MRQFTFLSVLLSGLIHLNATFAQDSIGTSSIIDTMQVEAKDSLKHNNQVKDSTESSLLETTIIKPEQQTDPNSINHTNSLNLEKDKKSTNTEQDSVSSKSEKDPTKNQTDLPSKVPIELSPSAASEYIATLVNRESLWRKGSDTLRLSLSRLVNHFFEPHDSISNRLVKFPFDSVQLAPTRFNNNDTIPLKWLTNNEFIIDSITLDQIPVIKQKTIVMRAIDSISMSSIDTLPGVKNQIESYLQVKDTITESFVDVNYLESKNIPLYKITENGITPPIRYQNRAITDGFNSDSSMIVVPKTRPGIIADGESPFFEVSSRMMPDSLKHAVETLLSYAEKRDSILIKINSINGEKTPFWLTTGKDDLYRYWIKNSNNDSITVWIGNPSKSNITLILEEEINLERMEKKVFDDIPFTTAKPNLTLAEVKALKEIPVYWDKEFSSSYSLNQNHLSNWARGGESSVISMIDVNAKAEYNNKEDKRKWTNTGRLKYGTTWTDAHGFRTNTDVIEANSQYNSAIFEKLDFSSGIYFRTQAAKGYNYPNDSVVISQFLNPGTFTISSGIEYKPNSNTSINFSPISYKNTFVLDTIKINQTAHGIDIDKKARQEMGGQLVVKNTATFFEDMKIENTLRLFSNYLEKPQNIDIDWEMSIEKQISWYFKIRLNFHLIYDDNIQFPVLDANEEPVLLPDGSEKKVPKVQINQLLGLTLSFKI